MMPQEEDATPNITDDESVGTPQALTKRYFWSKPKVQHKPTRQNKRDFKDLVEKGVYPS